MSCANIGPQEIAKRRTAGYVTGFITILTAATLLYRNSSKTTRLVIAPLLLFTGICFFQAQHKTCGIFAHLVLTLLVYLSAQRKMNMDTPRDEPVTDNHLQSLIEKEARQVWIKSFLLTAAGTVIMMLL
jgi:hypothetical protein